MFHIVELFTCSQVWNGVQEPMRLIARRSAREFYGKNPDAKSGLVRWMTAVEQAQWKTMDEVAQSFSKAKGINASRMRFDLGQGYRLIAAFNFGHQICFVKFIGTHAEYDKVDAATISQF